MAKKETQLFFCKSCGNEFVRWEGKCPTCGEWGGLVEAPSRSPRAGRNSTKTRSTRSWPQSKTSNTPKPLHTFSADNRPRIEIPIRELHRVLGGGAVPGGSVLVGGEPGIGKSTLLLQLLGMLSKSMEVKGKQGISPRPLLYISGEEAPHQIAARGKRLATRKPQDSSIRQPETKSTDASGAGTSINQQDPFNFDSDQLLLTSETDLEAILDIIGETKPLVTVIDSVQTLRDPELTSAPGTVTQVRECTMALTDAARRHETALFLIGHVTKDGSLAGPRVLEHIVDAVLSFEGETQFDLRLVRALKNRFGSTNEVGLFEMTSAGLCEVPDPSSVLLDRGEDGLLSKGPGTTVGAFSEGSRVLLVEVQALTVPVPGGGSPRRRASGLDSNRLAMLLAVLETKAGIPFGALDVFASAAGGFDIHEPASDLPLALALGSVATNRSVCEGLVAAGEIGLGGELRPMPRTEIRLAEAARLGFTKFLMPARVRIPNNVSNIKILRAQTVSEALAMGLGDKQT